MTKTLAEIISIVRFRGDMRNTNRFPDSNLTTEIQAAFSEGYALVVQENSGFYDTSDTVTTTNAVAFVALPPTTWITRAIDRQEGADFVPLPRIGIKDRNRYGTTPGRPTAHRLTARGIDLYPTPDAAYTLRVTYTPVAPTLDTTAREFYNSWEEYTISGALVRLYKNMGREATQWLQDLSAASARIKGEASERNSTGPELLNLHEGWEGSEDLDRWRPGF
jgi:hypothetical protein